MTKKEAKELVWETLRGFLGRSIRHKSWAQDLNEREMELVTKVALHIQQELEKNLKKTGEQGVTIRYKIVCDVCGLEESIPGPTSKPDNWSVRGIAPNAAFLCPECSMFSSSSP
jgi:hypothetical protein